MNTKETKCTATGKELDSCWNFFGKEYCLEEARHSAKYYDSKIDDTLNSKGDSE